MAHTGHVGPRCGRRRGADAALCVLADARRLQPVQVLCRDPAAFAGVPPELHPARSARQIHQAAYPAVDGPLADPHEAGDRVVGETGQEQEQQMGVRAGEFSAVRLVG